MHVKLHATCSYRSRIIIILNRCTHHRGGLPCHQHVPAANCCLSFHACVFNQKKRQCNVNVRTCTTHLEGCSFTSNLSRPANSSLTTQQAAPGGQPGRPSCTRGEYAQRRGGGEALLVLMRMLLRRSRCRWLRKSQHQEELRGDRRRSRMHMCHRAGTARPHDHDRTRKKQGSKVER